MIFMSGDARLLLSNRIRPGSIHSIFVNHPEPPQQIGKAGMLKSEAQHLLDLVNI